MVATPRDEPIDDEMNEQAWDAYTGFSLRIGQQTLL
jgi:hypothetical protein